MQSEIRNLISAPGWRAVTCSINDDKASFDESPLIAWGLDTDNQLIPITWDPELGAIDIRDDIETTANASGWILAPGETATDDLKQSLERRARAKRQ
jgi:hypothetical protein